MTVLDDRPVAPPQRREPLSWTALIFRRKIKHRSSAATTAAFIWAALLVIVTITAQWLPLHSDLFPAGSPGTLPHWGADFLGTDAAGRSMLSRLVHGAQISILISVISSSISLVVGGVLGLASAYFGPPISTIGEVVANSILAVPSLLLLLAIILAFSPSIPVITLACSLVFIPAILRLTRANASSELNREYVTAATALGASWTRVVFRELLPNTAPSLISYMALVLPAVMIAEGSLSFLGFGVQSPTPTWGNMIAFAYANLNVDPWPAIFPCVCLAATVFSLNTIGDFVRARLSVGKNK